MQGAVQSLSTRGEDAVVSAVSADERIAHSARIGCVSTPQAAAAEDAGTRLV